MHSEIRIDRSNEMLLQSLQFEWDDEKNAATHRKHGIAFADILPIFAVAETKALVAEDRRRDYGEQRFVLLCPFRTKIYHVTFTRRGDTIRLISARRANWKEVQAYETSTHDQGRPDG